MDHADFFAKLSAKRGGTTDPDLGCDVGGWGREFPYIFAVLAQLRVGDTTRQGGSLRIVCDAGQATVILTDRETGHIVFYGAHSIDMALQGLECELADGSADWRVDKWAKKTAEPKVTRQRRQKRV